MQTYNISEHEISMKRNKYTIYLHNEGIHGFWIWMTEGDKDSEGFIKHSLYLWYFPREKKTHFKLIGTINLIQH